MHWYRCVAQLLRNGTKYIIYVHNSEFAHFSAMRDFSEKVLIFFTQKDIEQDKNKRRDKLGTYSLTMMLTRVSQKQKYRPRRCQDTRYGDEIASPAP